jgi:hypothetical protein
MLKALYGYFIYVFSVRILVEYGILPNSAKWLVELFSVSIVPAILVIFAIRKRLSARPAYLVIFLITFSIVAISAVLNQSSASALILGFRHHFKYLPFFVLPLVYDFSEGQIKKILLLLSGILLLQMPVSVLQRFIWFPHLETGDVVGGTVGSSGVISIILISAICVLYALYLTRHIAMMPLLIFCLVLFLPTAINETKATIVILPVGLTLITLLFGDRDMLLKLKKISIYTVFIAIFASLFVYAYDVLYSSESESSLLTMMMREKEGRGYLYYGEEQAIDRIEQGYRIGRIDSIVMAYKNISKDIGHLVFGIGIGNTLDAKISFLRTESEDLRLLFPDMTTIANVLWELGIMGLILLAALLVVIFKDALAIRKQGSFVGALGLGWCSVVAIMAITLFYLNIFYSDALSTTFWFLSGIVASKAYRIRNSRTKDDLRNDYTSDYRQV